MLQKCKKRKKITDLKYCFSLNGKHTTSINPEKVTTRLSTIPVNIFTKHLYKLPGLFMHKGLCVNSSALLNAL